MIWLLHTKNFKKGTKLIGIEKITIHLQLNKKVFSCIYWTKIAQTFNMAWTVVFKIFVSESKTSLIEKTGGPYDPLYVNNYTKKTIATFYHKMYQTKLLKKSNYHYKKPVLIQLVVFKQNLFYG